MRKKQLFIKLLLLPITLILSSCGMNGKTYSHGDRSSYSYKPASSSIDDQSQHAKGKRVFDTFYDYASYQSDYEYKNQFRLSEFPNITFIKNDNGGFKTTIGAEQIASVETIYIADVNFDGYKDLCLGRMIEAEKINYAVFVYDVHNNTKTLELNEPADGATSKDYAFNLQDDLLVIESSYNCSLAAMDRFGYFKDNGTHEVTLEWQKIQFEITKLVEEIDENIHFYKGSDNRQRYIVNTTDTFTELYLYIEFIGDLSLCPFEESDAYFIEKSGYDLTITNHGVDYIAFSLKFNEEGVFDITFKLGPYQHILRFEANNHLYEMLEVA